MPHHVLVRRYHIGYVAGILHGQGLETEVLAQVAIAHVGHAVGAQGHAVRLPVGYGALDTLAMGHVGHHLLFESRRVERHL